MLTAMLVLNVNPVEEMVNMVMASVLIKTMLRSLNTAKTCCKTLQIGQINNRRRTMTMISALNAKQDR
jgi:hypothetical protein